MASDNKFSEFEEIQLTWEDELTEIAGKPPQFPKYTTQIMNIANQNAQGTRPKIVGQMSELIQECPERSYEGWKKWYQEQKPEAIDRAVNKIMPMIDNMKEAMAEIDEEMVREWVRDLVLKKTAEGLIIQEAVLKKLAEKEGQDCKLAGPEEESQNIDGYIGEKPVSVKPHTYLYKDSSVQENIEVEVVYYKKTGKYLYIYQAPED